MLQNQSWVKRYHFDLSPPCLPPVACATSIPGMLQKRAPRTPGLLLCDNLRLLRGQTCLDFKGLGKVGSCDFHNDRSSAHNHIFFQTGQDWGRKGGRKCRHPWVGCVGMKTRCSTTGRSLPEPRLLTSILPGTVQWQAFMSLKHVRHAFGQPDTYSLFYYFHLLPHSLAFLLFHHLPKLIFRHRWWQKDFCLPSQRKCPNINEYLSSNRTWVLIDKKDLDFYHWCLNLGCTSFIF